jgi:hypothetical protein
MGVLASCRIAGRHRIGFIELKARGWKKRTAKTGNLRRTSERNSQCTSA